AAKVKAEIAIVDDGQPFSGVKAPGPGGEIREMRRGGTDAGGTEARTGPVGGSEIVRHADDGDVHAAQVLGVAPAQKAERASVGLFPMHAIQRRGCEGLVGLWPFAFLDECAHNSFCLPYRSTPGLYHTGHRTGAQIAYAYVSYRSEEHTSELQSRGHLVCRLLLEKKKTSRS